MKEKKIAEILSKMTVEEKVAQTMVVPYAHMTKEEALKWVDRGVGAFLHVLGDEARELKRLAIEKGKVPLLFGIDAIHGHALKDNATIFPSQLSMACSFDPELIKAMGGATAKEVSADALHWTFSPVLCLGRDIRWGRVDETFGEDKYLSGVLGAAMIEGYQGDDLSNEGSILACAKHYIGYGEATGARDSYDTEITERKMRAEFLPPFEMAVKANCKTFMTAYGSLDGVPCTANKRLLKDILKEELGFDGFVVTDWDNIGHLVYDQRVAVDIAEGSKMALENGNDMMMNTLAYYESAIALVKKGEVDERLLDEAAGRVLAAKYDLGLLDNPMKEADQSCVGCEEHLEINRKLASESVVLLQNDGILPLQGEGKKIAVVGSSADDIRRHYGTWCYFTHPLPNQDAPPKRPYVTLLEGVRAAAKAHGGSAQFASGCEILSDDLSGVEEAVALAKESDVVVFACGDTYGQTGEGVDKADMTLTHSQRVLFQKLVETGKPIVTVLIATKPICIPEIAKGSNAVLTCFTGGMFGGEALARVIFGDLNPSGKLPISFPYHVGQQPCYYNYLPGWHASSYADMPTTPLYVFGEGLSYTKFAYSNAKFDKESMALTVQLKNVGARAGKEITQVYFKDLVSSVMTPVKQLIAFRKTALAAGEEVTLTFALKKEDFSLVNADGQRVTEKGEFEIMVGGSSKDSDLIKVKFEL